MSDSLLPPSSPSSRRPWPMRRCATRTSVEWISTRMVASAGHTPYLASLNGLCASHDTSLVAYAPAMIRHQNGRVSEMTDNAIEHLVVGEATVTTVVVEDEKGLEQAALGYPIQGPEEPAIHSSGAGSQRKHKRHIARDIAQGLPRILLPAMLRNRGTNVTERKRRLASKIELWPTLLLLLHLNHLRRLGLRHERQRPRNIPHHHQFLRPGRVRKLQPSSRTCIVVYRKTSYTSYRASVNSPPANRAGPSLRRTFEELLITFVIESFSQPQPPSPQFPFNPYTKMRNTLDRDFFSPPPQTNPRNLE
jgi:hypothetical protein